MKRYRSSDLSRNVAAVIKEAKANGVIIECRRSNGEVEEELVFFNKSEFDEVVRMSNEMVVIMKELAIKSGISESELNLIIGGNSESK